MFQTGTLALIMLLQASGATAPPMAAPTAAKAPVDPMADNGRALLPAGSVVSQVAFAYADRNADVLVSWEEYRNRALRIFTRIDADGDATLQITELQALGGKGAPAAPFDISVATFNAAARKQFDTADKDSDGVLTPAEWRDVVRPGSLLQQERAKP